MFSITFLQHPPPPPTHTHSQTHSVTPVPPGLSTSWSQIPAERSGETLWSVKPTVCCMAPSPALQVLQGQRRMCVYLSVKMAAKVFCKEQCPHF